jgi:surface antigen
MRARILLAVAVAVATVGGVGGVVSAAQATTGTNDYPYAGSAVDQVDRWNFYTRECTSFVAWRINNDAGVAFTNQYGGVTWGNAGNWASAARAVGVAVDTTPTVGSVAQFPGGVDGAGSMGHVAWVIGVGNGTVTVEDYNYSDAYDGYTYYNYSQHTVATAGLNFIHFAGVAGPAETWINPATAKFLDLDHGRSADGTKIQLWSDSGGSAQRWIRVSSPGGYYKITNKGTGKCVDVQGPSTADGAPVHEWSCYGTDSQLWKYEGKGRSVSGYPVYQIRNKLSGKCLDITGFGTADGTPIQQWTCTGGTNQEWY